MINFRYHIVSITAVFLALGIGVALGSTFLDQATVDVLNRNIRSAENRIKDTNAENEQLRATDQRAQARDQALVQDAAAFLGDDLTDVPVVVVVAPGVDGDVVDRILGVLDATGADLRGTLSLTDRTALPITAEFDFRQTGPQTWNISVVTDDGQLLLSSGGRRLALDDEVRLDGTNAEYPSLYRRFLELSATSASDVDLAPLRLVADAFLLGRRCIVEPFED